MDSTTERLQRPALRYAPWITAALLLSGAVAMGLLRGAPAVVLWLAFATLCGAALFFWESLRLLLDPDAPGDDMTYGDQEGVPAELEARKRAALRALRDIEFERAIQRLSDEDYKALEKKYRAEARSAMVAIEQGLGPWLKKAGELIAAEDKGADKKPEKVIEKVTEKVARLCAKCDARNDSDAVFCKKCGARIERAADAS